MKKQLFITLILCSMISSCLTPEDSKLVLMERGVSKKLNDHRKEALSSINYKIHLDIPKQKLEDIKGSISIVFSCKNLDHIIIDFQEDPDHIISVQYENEAIKYNFENHHIYIPINSDQSDHKIDIDFIAGNLSLNRNEDFLYTLFVPDRASTAIPLFDQPNLKGTYQLNLNIPQDWEAIANGQTISQSINKGRKQLEFQKTAPISTYLFAFATGLFQRHSEIMDQDTIEFLYRENDPEKIGRNLPEIVRLHKDARNWLEEYTGIPYPFHKYGWATIPPFQYGGMEHPGAIFYRERSLFLDESATASQKLGRASLIAHEVAHMWFGDLVTMDWFDDVWLKEVFANFMAAKIVQPNFPDINHDVRFLLSHFPSSYSVDRTEGANPILQPLSNLKDAGSVYGDIIYHKAPIVMQMLENKIGEKAMQTGLQEYLNKYAFDNAVWDDLISLLDKDGKLRGWSDVWVKEAGMPKITILKDGDLIVLKASDPQDKNRKWPQIISMIGAAENKFEFVTNAQFPIKDCIFEYPNVPYGEIQLDQELIKNISTNLEYHKEADRGYLWVILHEQFINGLISKERYFELLRKSIRSERDPLVLNLLLNYVQEALGKFSKNDTNHNGIFEDLFWMSLMEKPDNLKKYFFDGFVAVTKSEESQQKLIEILNNESTIPITISQRDRIRIVYQLALLKHTGWQQLLELEKQKITNPDYAKQIEFTSQFLTDDSEKLDSLFSLFEDPSNREREPWVLEAMRLLNHNSRRVHALKYIQPSLEWLEDIQKTGDIFFPKRWLDALFSGHNSKEVVEVVNEFLNNSPTYPKTLKRKILQAVDLVKRASKIESKLNN